MTETPSFIEALNRAQTEFSGRPFLGTKTQSAYKWETYLEVFQRAQHLKESLEFRPGEVVALVSNNRKEWVYIMLAAMASGATLVPMYASETLAAQNFILEDAKADRVICASSALAEKLECARKDTFETIDWSVGETLDLTTQYHSETAFILYTSGTTADPKGVPLSHDNIAHTIATLSSRFPLKKEDRSLSFLPWAHSFGLIVELITLCVNGASIGIAESVQTIIPNLGEVKPTLLISVPKLFAQFHASVQKRAMAEGAFSKRIFDDVLGKNKGIFSSFRKTVYKKKYVSRVNDRFGGELRYAISGGAALSPETQKFMNAIGIEVYEGYGLTETSALVSFNLPNASKIGSVGKPACEIRISSDAQFEKGIGEICVRGDGIMSGYLNRPGTSFTDDGFFQTGDIGRIDNEGYLWILGRLKEQYKLSTGKYVAPTQLEDQLKKSKYVEHVFLYGENQAHNIALVQLDENETMPENENIEALILDSFNEFGGDFRRFEFPKNILIIENIANNPELLTPSGKLKRGKLFELYREEIKALF